MKHRVIFHADCNAFYASVEETIHPELKNVPMAVCGDPKSRRGIILAKNERAKRFGIQTAETIWQAQRKCPELVLVPPRRGLYQAYCEQINAIYDQYTDQVERFGIDESYLDVTGSLSLFRTDGEGLAHVIRERVFRETGLTISVGVSYNKIFAKIGSDYKKPNAVTCITPENYRQIVWPLPASDLLLVGKVMRQSLARHGICTIGQLAQADLAFLRLQFGKTGEQMHLYANGLDDSPVLRADEQPDAQSIGHGMTFPRSLVTRSEITTALTALADGVASRMRHEGVKCCTVQLSVKDDNLKVITRQTTLPEATCLARDLVAVALALLDKSWPKGKPIRLLALTGQKLVPQDQVIRQLSLLDDEESQKKRERLEQLEKAVDGIRAKYGHGSISYGSLLHNDLGINTEKE